MPTLTNEIITAAIRGFEEQKREIDEQITGLRSMLSDGTAQSRDGGSASRFRRKMSAAGRRAIAEAQRKRWAAKAAASPEAPPKPKRKLSAAGRAAIVAAAKKRWAGRKAAAKAGKS